MKEVKERTTPDLLELTLQLHSRASDQPQNKEAHEAYIEARQELEKRLQINKNDGIGNVMPILHKIHKLLDVNIDEQEDGDRKEICKIVKMCQDISNDYWMYIDRY